MYNHGVYLKQVGLKDLGFNPGPLDGLDGPKTAKAYQASLKLRFGSSRAKDALRGYPPKPKPKYHSKVSVFGSPGKKGGYSPPMAYFKPPYPMVFSWGGKVTKIGCHKLVAKPFKNAMEELLDIFGYQWLQDRGLTSYAGCYNPRKSRGSNAISDHAWAIAFDFAPNREGNGLRDRWRARYEGSNGVAMPLAAVKVFQKHGFQVGFSVRSGVRRDMMHISYVDRG